VKPLENIKVVSLEQAVAAPMCTRRLVMAGAEVFKIERPSGDFARYYDTSVAGESAYFVWLNAGKQSVVLNLREDDDLAVLRQLIDRCDVLVQNLKPGALTALGIDLAELHVACPGLISVSISGFHPSGPGAQRKAYDLLMQAESGLADITGSAQAPGRVGVSVVDIATGSFAYEAILEALLVKSQTGQGERINVSLFDAVAQWMAVPYLLEKYAEAAPKRVGLAHPGICPYGVFTSADGQPFVLSIQNEREWRRLCEVGIHRAELITDGRCTDNETRVKHRGFVDGVLQDVFGRLGYAAVEQQLGQADLAFAPLNTVAQLKTHADFRTQAVVVGEELIELPVMPGIAGLSNAQAPLVVPKLGEHTDKVRTWLRSTQANSGL